MAGTPGFTIKEVTDGASLLSSIKVPDGAGTFAGMTLGEVLEDLCHVSKGDWWWSHRHAAAFSLAGLNVALSSLHRRLTMGMKDPPTTFIGWLRKNHTITNYTHFVKRGGQAPVCETELGAGDKAINMWRPLPPVPETILKRVRQDAGAVKLWLMITSDLCNGDKEHLEQLLDWAAFVAMVPEDKPGFSIVLYSSMQGIGKDMFVYGISRALGLGACRTISRKAIERDFNPYMEKRLVHVSDLHTTTRGSMNGSDVYSTLKQATSNYPKTVEINPKYEPQYDADNLSAWIISTNDEAPMTIPQEDRRWFVVEGRDTKREVEFYDAVDNWFKEPETGVLIRAFLQLRWDSMSKERRAAIYGIAPETAAKLRMIDAGMTPVQAAIKDMLDDDDKRDLIRLEDIETHLINLKVVDRLARNAPIPSRTSLGIVMKKFKAALVPEGKDGKPLPARLPNKSIAKVYAVRRIETYKALSVAEVGKLYVEQAAAAQQRARSSGKI